MGAAFRVAVPILAFALAGAPATASAAGGERQTLRGVVTIEFPAFDRTEGGCAADAKGSVSKLKRGNRVRIYRGRLEDPADNSSLDVGSKPIGKGKVGHGKVNRDTRDCDVAFTARRVPVLPPDEFYVVEVRGIATTQTVSAARVEDGNLGAIPASI
jgi:hypothetical protein